MKNIKKIVKAGEGLVIFLTKEARELGWNDKTNILLETDANEKKITLKEI